MPDDHNSPPDPYDEQASPEEIAQHFAKLELLSEHDESHPKYDVPTVLDRTDGLITPGGEQHGRILTSLYRRAPHNKDGRTVYDEFVGDAEPERYYRKVLRVLGG